MSSLKYYAGIGSRKAPEDVLEFMTELAETLAKKGYVLRSGGARGADSAFERGAGDSKEIFRPEDSTPESDAYAEEFCMPKDRSGFRAWAPYIRGLISRNMMQVLGRNLDSPVDFVVCWAPSEDYTDSSAGGTGYAIRCALRNGIPVFNLWSRRSLEEFNRFAEGK